MTLPGTTTDDDVQAPEADGTTSQSGSETSHRRPLAERPGVYLALQIVGVSAAVIGTIATVIALFVR
jgi:hypothetical protein